MHELDGFSILVVDDHPLFREGLALALTQRVPGISVTAVAAVTDAIHLLETMSTPFDLLLLDYRLPGEDGLTCARNLRELYPGIACALMSGSDDQTLPMRAEAAGLAGFFPKSFEIDHLLAGLLALANGETYFLSTASGETESALTARQRDIVKLAARGASNKEIAEALGITPHTVRNHLTQIFERLGARNRAQAVSMAYKVQDE